MKTFARDPVEDRDRAIQFNPVECDLGHVLACKIGWSLLVCPFVPLEFVRFTGGWAVQFENQVLKPA